MINAFGRDRPGLVAAITHQLYEEEANLGDLQMTRLGGIFALLLEFYLPETKEADVRKKLKEVASEKSLEINLVPAASYSGGNDETTPDTIITLHGADHPGIVAGITELLGENDVNIVNLETRLKGKESGEDLYLMVLEVNRPESLSREQLSTELQRTAEQLETHVKVRPFAPPEL